MKSYVQSLGRQAGIGMHLSSLPGRHGIGDIADSAVSFLDALQKMDIGVWQFLPLGPTAYGDSPYQPLSAFAGNTMLLGPGPLVRLGLLESTEVEVLESLPRNRTDFSRLIPLKNALLDKAAERFQSKPNVDLQIEFEDFLHESGALWLDDYALFRALKSYHGERPWPEWERDLVRREPHALSKAANKHREVIERIHIIQFLFDKQWKELKSRASGMGIYLFGDMPIYLALDSSDAWAQREMLQISEQGIPSHVAGVPPDYFSESGQLWGNPLYDWEYHKRSGFRWWVERMRHNLKQTHLVRVDHFRGFESFWSVAYGESTARVGEWLPGPGGELFEALQSSLRHLPIVAEDLGLITPQVEQLRQSLGLPGMKVLQFEVDHPDFDPSKFEKNSVCYTGTHDNDTSQGWFQGSGEDTRTEEEKALTRKAILNFTGGSAEDIHTNLIRLAFSSNSTLAIAPMQDFLGLDSSARFNTPGTTQDNWCWRMAEGQLDSKLVDWVGEQVTEASRAPSKRLDFTP